MDFSYRSKLLFLGITTQIFSIPLVIHLLTGDQKINLVKLKQKKCNTKCPKWILQNV